MVDQRVQTLRPHSRVDRPVPEPGAVVPAAAEPAVVEDEPLHADLGRGVREMGERVEVVLHVGRFPGVRDDGSGAAGPGRLASQPGVHAR